MEYKKRIKVRVGEKPRRDLRNAVLIISLILLLLGISDFVNSQFAKIKLTAQCIEEMSPIALGQFQSANFRPSEDDIYRQAAKLCEDKERQGSLNRSFYLTLPGAILLVITIFI